MEMALLLLVVAICVCAVLIHIHRARGQEHYFRCLLCGRDQENRMHEYDWIRLFALIMVMATHVIQTEFASGPDLREGERYVLTIAYVFCLVCNPLYVMLSASLLLEWRDEGVLSFYWRRFLRVVVPMLSYFFLYLYGQGELMGATTPMLLKDIGRFCLGDTPEAPHYWLLYEILSIYLLMPFLRYLTKAIPYRALGAMLLLYGAFAGVLEWLPALSGWFPAVSEWLPAAPAVTFPIDPWVAVAIAGFWATRKESKAFYKPLALAGFCALALTALVIWRDGDYLTLCCNDSVLAMLMALGIFALVFLGRKYFHQGNLLLRILSKYNYSMLLAHWGVLYVFTRKIPGIGIEEMGYFGVVAQTFLTFALSLAVGIAVDQLLVVVPSACFEKLGDVVKSHFTGRAIQKR